MSNMIADWRAALDRHGVEAKQARALLDSWTMGSLPRVPGMDTTSRLAMRIFYGRSIEGAAVAEYLYRWHLAVKDPDQCMLPANSARNPCVSCFGAPHPIGL